MLVLLLVLLLLLLLLVLLLLLQCRVEHAASFFSSILAASFCFLGLAKVFHFQARIHL